MFELNIGFPQKIGVQCCVIIVQSLFFSTKFSNAPIAETFLPKPPSIIKVFLNIYSI